jgi:integrase
VRPRHTGSLWLRGRIWWARYYHNGVRVTVSTHETDRGKAATVLKNLLKDAGTPRFVAPAVQKVTFEDICDLLRRDHARRGNRSRIEYKLRHLAEHFSGWPALRITTVEVEQYADARRASGAALATTNRELASLRRAFRLALRAGILPSMPTISTPSEAGNERQGFLDLTDLDGFLTALRQHDAVAADCAEFAFLTCLRRCNVLAATWTWFALEVTAGHVVGGELRLPGTATKNKKALTLPLTGRLLALVDRRWRARLARSPLVFHRAGGERVIRFAGAWAAAAEETGRPAFLFHDLRRSGARALRRLGVDELTIMALGGWKTRSMFARYSIVDTQDLADAQAKLDVALAAAGPRKVAPLRRRQAGRPR